MTSVSSRAAQARLALALSVAAALLLAVATVSAAVAGMLARPEWRPIGTAAELRQAVPQLYTLENSEFYLAWVGSTPIALSTRDPHKGCRIRWYPEWRLFADPCGGSAYDPDGRYRSGPSPRSMDELPTRVVGGRVEVDITRITPGRQHA